MIEYGRIAYEEYCNFSDYKSLVSGTPLPKWENLPKEIATAWNYAANAVVKKVNS